MGLSMQNTACLRKVHKCKNPVCLRKVMPGLSARRRGGRKRQAASICPGIALNLLVIIRLPVRPFQMAIGNFIGILQIAIIVIIPRIRFPAGNSDGYALQVGILCLMLEAEAVMLRFLARGQRIAVRAEQRVAAGAQADGVVLLVRAGNDIADAGDIHIAVVLSTM